MPGQHMMNPAMSQSITQAAYPVPHAEYSTDTVIYKGGPPNQRGPLPQVSLVQPTQLEWTGGYLWQRLFGLARV